MALTKPKVGRFALKGRPAGYEPSDPVAGARHDATQDLDILLNRRPHPRPRTLIMEFDGVGSVIPVGMQGNVSLHFDSRIIGWQMVADAEGDIEIDVWRCDFEGYPPDVSSSITGTDVPKLVAQDKNRGDALDWLSEVYEGDILRFNVDSAATVTKVTLMLKLVAEGRFVTWN